MEDDPPQPSECTAAPVVHEAPVSREEVSTPVQPLASVAAPEPEDMPTPVQPVAAAPVHAMPVADSDAVSQLTESASRGSLEEEGVPITDIYFVSG